MVTVKKSNRATKTKRNSAQSKPERRSKQAKSEEKPAGETGSKRAPARKVEKSVPSAKTLVVVESPAKAKTVQKYLSDDYIVLASKGHVKDLPKRGGVDLENGFKESYEIIADKGKEEVIRQIKQQAAGVTRVLLATDPDREGEAIAWHIKEEIEAAGHQMEIRRVLLNEITHKGVLNGIDHPCDLDANLYEAQRTRRVLDRIGGYPLSNLLWRKLVFGLSAGRVQTPALRILVDRQTAIDSFLPRPYWLIETLLASSTKAAFSAQLESVNGEKLEKVASKPAATSEIDAKRFEEDLKRAGYRVVEVTKRERSSRPPAPYITSKLQQDAANRLGMQPQRTMRIAQALYEGISLGKGKSVETVGLITYMRTDSVRLSDESIAECRDYIARRFSQASLPKTPNTFKIKKKGVQDAHEAIRPTRMDLPPETVRPYLSDERYKLYKLIWDRFVACQMIPALYDQTGVEIQAKAGNRVYGLRASGSILKVPGWKLAYDTGDSEPLAGEEGEQPQESDRALPELSPNERLALQDPGVVVVAKQTEPPSYFTEASLVKKLEEEGIGRPSTYAEILSKVQARDYVHKVKNKLVPTELGRLVVRRLVENRFDLADIDFTRKLEEDLDAIAEARGKRIDVLAPFHKKLQERIELSLNEKRKWWPDPEPIGEACPECGKQLVKRWGRNGLFIGCEGYPDCTFTRNIDDATEEKDPDKQAIPTDYICERCGAPMLKRWGRNGWFLGCSTFPKCKHTRSIPLGVSCPKCGGEIIEIRARGRKRPFYGCSNFAGKLKCDFRIWQRPVPEVCPRCQAQFLVRNTTANRTTLRCITEGCGYERELETSEKKQERLESDGRLSATGTETTR
ncbi:MAG: type I DNA topoisomerase [Deltaproteobacteria bacterium]|nr:type I DNA topoisomerase [Deltaproteobacteria bacterium]